jgi:hypothetical protein
LLCLAAYGWYLDFSQIALTITTIFTIF